MKINKTVGISSQEEQLVKEWFDSKASALGVHEAKSHYIVGVPISYYYPVLVNHRKFIVAPTKVFKAILEKTLLDAVIEYPNNFGSYNAGDVLKALYDIEPVPPYEDFETFLAKEVFAYVFEISNNIVFGDVLRIELFRKIVAAQEKQRGTEFQGGLLHAFKHFSYHNTPLSTKPSKNNLSHPRQIICLFIEAFFISPRTRVNHLRYTPKAYQSFTSYNQRVYFSAFYFEEKTNQFFLNSIRIKK